MILALGLIFRHDPDSAGASEMVRNLPDHILKPSTLEPAED